MRRAIARGTGLTRHLLAFSRRRPVNPGVDRPRRPPQRHARDARCARSAGDIDVRDGVRRGRLAGRSRRRRDGAGDAQPVRQRARRHARRRRHHDRRGERCRSADGASRRRDFVKLSVADTGCGHAAGGHWRASSSRSSRPRTSARDRAWACRRSTASRSNRAGESRSTARSASGTVVTLLLPRSLQRSGRDAGLPTSRRAAASQRRRTARARAAGRRRPGSVGAHARDAQRRWASRSPTSTERRSGARRARQRPARRRRAVRHHDAGRRQRPRTGARDPRRHPTLPIVLTTGYVEAAARMKDGEFDLLLKPYSLEALADALGVEVT